MYREWKILSNIKNAKKFVGISVGISLKYVTPLIPELLKGQLRLR
jgi:hypothetical protein